MEKLTSFFTTEIDSGKDTSRRITDRLEPLAAEMDGTEMYNPGRFATPGRASLPRGEVFADHENHPKGNGVSEVVRMAVKAKGAGLFLDPIDVVMAKDRVNYVELVHK